MPVCTVLAVHYINFHVFHFDQDITSNVQNRTLIIDNGNHQLSASQAEVAGWDETSYQKDGGRTWITDNTTGELNKIHILGRAHVALSPQLTRYTNDIGMTFDIVSFMAHFVN